MEATARSGKKVVVAEREGGTGKVGTGTYRLQVCRNLRRNNHRSRTDPFHGFRNMVPPSTLPSVSSQLLDLPTAGTSGGTPSWEQRISCENKQTTALGTM